MDENIIPQDHLPEAHNGAEPDLHELTVEPEPVETRGIGWIIVPALLGLVIGTLIGLVKATSVSVRPTPEDARELLLPGAGGWALIGLIAGGVFGLLIWVLFPYKGRNPHAYQPEEQPAKTASEGIEEHGQ